jgi:hypothetical protein
VHRVRQFAAHLRARVAPEEERLAQDLLTPEATRLFASMPVPDRRHALDVAGRLLALGVDDRDVLTAALLHDAAKGYRMRLWHRVAGVLLAAMWPSMLRRLADPTTRSWRYPFHLYLHHASLSADLAVAAGASERAGSFIRGSAAEADAHLLRALTDADDAS